MTIHSNLPMNSCDLAEDFGLKDAELNDTLTPLFHTQFGNTTIKCKTTKYEERRNFQGVYICFNHPIGTGC